MVATFFWHRADALREVREKLALSRKNFRDRLDAEISEIFDSLFHDVRQDLTEAVFRLDLEASRIAPLLDESFKIGEAASEMVLRAQSAPALVPQAQSLNGGSHNGY
jgi:hypothetical protein